ncbi:SCO1664 family protein [Ornithinicoccus hortensis]|uniref:Putative repeat protein (TIGR03843 family) n=1 Tax=Ornithinicoccus hortensis TaxID=82346 RepID=A0A542YSY2_9MICO|nr:SCO1664 family protein [Ornithinicoccus hortensis]TQL51167.1 putative repeat protein (TIGR03843 family) [Ornithinicoccus hortensis]
MSAGAEWERLLREAPIEVEGVLRDASNLTLKVTLGDGEGGTAGAAVYKPVRGERPLHDFPTGTLAGREVAAYLISAAGGWDLVPPTVLRDGPLGSGSVQWWIEQPEKPAAAPGAGYLEVVVPEDLRPGWRPVLQAESPEGDPLLVVHAEDPALASLAVFDAVINNADRKGSHLLRAAQDRLWGVDHGVSMHREDKLRTVLWGWAGEQLPETELASLRRVLGALDDYSWCAELLSVVSEEEVAALSLRVAHLVEAGTFPLPPAERYPLPWPLW